MSYPPPSSPGDAAAHAFSNLSLNKEREQRHRPGEGPPSSYPPSLNPPSPYSSQGPPYLTSPISGVVTGLPYNPPSPGYTQPPPYESHDRGRSDGVGSSPLRPTYASPTSPNPSTYPPPDPYRIYPPSAPPDLNLPENLDVFSAGKEEIKESSYPQYYGGHPAPKSEGYPSTPSEYPPKFNESNPGSQPYPNFTPYGAPPSAMAIPYSQPERHDGQGKQQTKKEFDSPTSNYDGSPSFSGADQPRSGYPPSGRYPPLSGPYDQSAVSVGHPPQQAGAQNPPPAGYPRQFLSPGEQTIDPTVSSSSESVTPEGTTERGFQHGQHSYGGYPQPGYAQPGYSQPGYGQPMYPQPGYGAYPSHGYAPGYPPAYPAQGYAPEGYPSHGYGVPGYAPPYAHGGHGNPQHAPAPYGAYGAAPYFGGQGHYKHHKGGHKQKKMKKGHQFEQLYGDHGGHHGGHHDRHHGGHHGHHGHH
jgi:hypothetical protein